MFRSAALAVVFAASCGDNSDHGVAIFDWHTRTPGALRLDRLAPDDPSVNALVDDRAVDDAAALFYGHYTGDATGTTDDVLDALLSRIDDAGLPYLTFHDLADGPPRRGVNLSFDDDNFAPWHDLRAVLARHHATATFFITRYSYASADEKAFVHDLATDGHDIEAHSIDHLSALTYVHDHGIAAYLADQVLPSFAVLEADGYAPVAFAYPYGATSPEIDAALLAEPGIALVRRIATP